MAAFERLRTRSIFVQKGAWPEKLEDVAGRMAFSDAEPPTSSDATQ